MKMPAVIFAEEDLIPAEVLPYLLPTERVIIIVRRSRAVLLPSPCVLVADATAFALSAADVIPGGAAVLAILGALLVPSSYFFYHSVLAWQRTYFALTNSRMILINWQRKRRLTVIPVAEGSDMSLIRTLPGQLMGYGSFLLRRSELPKRARKISHLPFPEQLYLEVAGLIYSDD